MSHFNPDIHHRHSIRMPSYDYSSAGAYFITICTYKKEHLFGEIRNGIMGLNEIGMIIVEELYRSIEIRKEVALDAWVVMPNHIHLILYLSDVGAHGRAPNTCRHIETDHCSGAHDHAPLQMRKPRSLSTFIAGFKFGTMQRLKSLQTPTIWQRNYYERIIRSEEELYAVREYIRENPRRWKEDEENINVSNY